VNAYDNVSVTGTSDVDTTVSYILILKVLLLLIVPVLMDCLSTLTDPVAVGTIITAVASDAAGNILLFLIQ
jgi:hypothetical protein